MKHKPQPLGCGYSDGIGVRRLGRWLKMIIMAIRVVLDCRENISTNNRACNEMEDDSNTKTVKVQKTETYP